MNEDLFLYMEGVSCSAEGFFPYLAHGRRFSHDRRLLFLYMEHLCALQRLFSFHVRSWRVTPSSSFDPPPPPLSAVTATAPRACLRRKNSVTVRRHGAPTRSQNDHRAWCAVCYKHPPNPSCSSRSSRAFRKSTVLIVLTAADTFCRTRHRSCVHVYTASKIRNNRQSNAINSLPEVGSNR